MGCILGKKKKKEKNSNPQCLVHLNPFLSVCSLVFRPLVLISSGRWVSPRLAVSPGGRRSFLLLLIWETFRSHHMILETSVRGRKVQSEKPRADRSSTGRGPAVPSIRRQGQMGLPTAPRWWDFWMSWSPRWGKCHRPSKGKVRLSEVGRVISLERYRAA